MQKTLAIILMLLIGMMVSGIGISINKVSEVDARDVFKVKTKQTIKWTFMVYMDGDNNLEEAAIEDFLEMSSVGSTSNVDIVVLLDRTSGYDTTYGNWTDARIFHIEYEEEPYPDNADYSLEEVNMGDPDTLFFFVNWTIKNYPADKYFLVLWDHGGGVDGCCYDETSSNDQLTVLELYRALRNISDILGIHLNIIGFDACLMSSIDVAYAIAPFANYMVASEEYEPGDGWPYDDILSYLTSNYLDPDEEVANRTAFLYATSYCYGSQGYDSNVTSAVIDLSVIKNEIPVAISYFSKVAIKNFTDYESILINASIRAEKFSPKNYAFVDLLNYSYLVYEYALDKGYMELANAALNLVYNLSDAIVTAYYIETHEFAYGLSAPLNYTYDPLYNVQDYDKTPLANVTLWDEFVALVQSSPYDAWLYDAWFEEKKDTDGDGFYESVVLAVDVDSPYDNEPVSVDVYGTLNGETYYLNGSEFSVSGYEVDPVNITITFPSSGKWHLEIEVASRFVSSTVVLTYGFVYLVTDDVYSIGAERDSTPPRFSISVENGTTINKTYIVVEWSCWDDESGVAKVSLALYKDGSCNWIDIPESGSYNITGLEEGTNFIYFRAYDNAGNVRLISIKVIVDKEPPVIEILNSIPSKTTQENISIEWNVKDNTDVSQVEIYVNGTLVEKTTESSGKTIIRLEKLGKYVITIFALDKAGNKATYTIIVERIAGQESEKEEGTGNYQILIIPLLIGLVLITAVLVLKKSKRG